eukprot:4318556-Pyramimonas_sp.AAC.1
MAPMARWRVGRAMHHLLAVAHAWATAPPLGVPWDAHFLAGPSAQPQWPQAGRGQPERHLGEQWAGHLQAS